MPKRSSKPPSDVNALAKYIVDRATAESAAASLADGEIISEAPEPDKNPAAVALGRLGGLKGGAARAKSLSKKERSRIAKKAARARWRAKRAG